MSVLKDLIGQAKEYFSVSFLYHLTAIHNQTVGSRHTTLVDNRHTSLVVFIKEVWWSSKEMCVCPPILGLNLGPRGLPQDDLRGGSLHCSYRKIK